MIDISVVTFTMGGRDKYLLECLLSVEGSIPYEYIYTDNGTVIIPKIRIEHHIVFQGVTCPDSIKLATIPYLANDNIFIHEWPTNIGIGAGLNKILPECKGNLVFKADDDCKIISNDFFEKAYVIHQRFPNSCFSPYPVGLINNPGGPKGFKHSVYHDKTNDKIYTRRHVNHIGGFARFSPASIIKNFTFPNDLISGISGTEDGNFSDYCNSNNIEMFYLENSMVVEHLESTLGQVVRYPEYFTGRSSESKLKIEVIE